VFHRQLGRSLSPFFSPDGHFLVATEGSKVLIWSIRDGSSKTLDDDHSIAFSVAFSPDGRHITSVDYYGWISVWHVRTGQLLDKWKGHAIYGNCVAFSPDGKGLVSGANDGILKYWDASSLVGMKMGKDRARFQQIRKFEGHSVRHFWALHSSSYNAISTGINSVRFLFASVSMDCD
jgi:WD40 repeat protein